MNEYHQDDLHITVVTSHDDVVVTWRGESDARNPRESLGPYLSEVARKLGSRTVRVTFAELTFMNSATVLPIMDFLKDLSKSATKVTVEYRQDLQWQVTSFRALRIVARTWGNVSVVGV
jgi:anti-anti-sigma regulatory factor